MVKIGGYDPAIFAERCRVWQANGKMYGYPQCCIDEFCSPEPAKGLRKEMAKDGFVPCLKHAKQLKAGKITHFSLTLM